MSSAFIKQTYSAILGRNADPEGEAYWTQQIASGTSSGVDVAIGFLNSPEFVNIYGPIAKLYYTVFNRIPDAGGLRYWVDVFKGGASLNAIANEFAKSAEYNETYGSNQTNEAFLEAVYQNVLGRKPDAEGQTYWLGQLTGGLSRAEVLAGFTTSPEFNTLHGEQVDVILTYVGILNRTPTQSEIDQSLLLNSRASLVSSLYSNAEYSGVSVPGLSAEGNGVVVDGYIAGATVMRADGSGTPVTTDANGKFVGLMGSGPIVVTGGRDISTGQDFLGELRAPEGSSVVTPLTTLVEVLVAQGQTVAAATNAVLTALDLPTTFNLLAVDPVSAVREQSSSAQAAEALAIQKAGVQVATLLQAAGANSTGGFEAALKSLAEIIATTDAPVDLAASAIITALGVAPGNVSTLSAGLEKIATATNLADIATNQSNTLLTVDPDKFEVKQDPVVNPNDPLPVTPTDPVTPAPGGGGGGVTPSVPQTFTVTNDAGVVTFGGNASGDITIVENADFTWSFKKGNTLDSNSVKIALEDFEEIIVGIGQTLSATAAQVDNLKITGAGTVAVTEFEPEPDTYGADLSFITAAISFSVPQAESASFTGALGSSEVFVKGGGELLLFPVFRVENGVIPDIGLGAFVDNNSKFFVEEGSTLVGYASQLSRKSVVGGQLVVVVSDGDNGIGNLGDLVTNNFVRTSFVTAVFDYGDVSYLDVTGIDGFYVLPYSGLKMTAEQAVDRFIDGEGGVTVLGSEGPQTFTIGTTGSNWIAGGKGADSITLSEGADYVQVDYSSRFLAKVTYDLTNAEPGNALLVTIGTETFAAFRYERGWSSFTTPDVTAFTGTFLLDPVTGVLTISDDYPFTIGSAEASIGNLDQAVLTTVVTNIPAAISYSDSYSDSYWSDYPGTWDVITNFSKVNALQIESFSPVEIDNGLYVGNVIFDLTNAVVSNTLSVTIGGTTFTTTLVPALVNNEWTASWSPINTPEGLTIELNVLAPDPDPNNINTKTGLLHISSYEAFNIDAASAAIGYDNLIMLPGLGGVHPGAACLYDFTFNELDPVPTRYEKLLSLAQLIGSNNSFGAFEDGTSTFLFQNIDGSAEITNVDIFIEIVGNNVFQAVPSSSQAPMMVF